MQKIRWGILATGGIAEKFARGLSVLPDAELVAVGSRTAERAKAFARKFAVANAYDSYEGLANDPEVDVIYVATPHPFHHNNTRLCLEAGKAVLCEKSFTVNAREALNIIEFARQKKLFLMEAMWTRFLPVMDKVRHLIESGAIGEPRMLQADFGFRKDLDPNSRLFSPELGGGALLDVGIYPLSLTSMLWGKPKEIHATAHLGITGVDEQAAMILKFDEGKIAVLTAALRTNTTLDAWILGTEGRIKIHRPWWKGQTITLYSGDSEKQINAPMIGNGYNYEAAAVMDCLRNGQTEHPLMPLDESLAIMQTMDSIRQQWGLQYPSEVR